MKNRFLPPARCSQIRPRHRILAGSIGALVTGIAALLALPQSGRAAAWDNGAGTVNWADAANWNPDTGLVLAGDTVSFGVAGVSGTTLNNDIIGQVLTGMSFNAGTAAWLLNGNAVTFSGTLANDSTNTQTINLPLDLSGSLTISGGASVQLGGAIGQGGTAGNRTISNRLSGGSLTLSGTLSLADGSTRTFTIDGHRDTLISGAIQDGGAGSGNLTKQGAGTLTLSGANTFTGALLAQGGNTVLDYSGANDPLGASASATILGSTLTFKGKASGTTAETVNVLALGSGTSTTSKLVLDANGGSGFALTANTLNGSGSTLQEWLIDLSSSAGNSLTATLGTTVAVANGVLINNTNRAAILVKDSVSVGFATTTATTSVAGAVTRLSSLTTMPASNAGSASVNYLYDGANDALAVGTGAAFANNTITVDSSGGTATLNLASGTTIGSGGVGSGFLARGTNDITINTVGGSGNFNAGTWLLHNYLTGGAALYLHGNFSNTATEVLSGPGLTIYSGTGISNAISFGFNLSEGILRVTTAQDWSTPGSTGLSNGAGNGLFHNAGLLELAADVNGATAGDFSNAVGSSAGSNQIQFIGDSGVSAFGGNRVFNFGGAAGTLTWGTNGFLASPGTTITDGDHKLLLSSAVSDSTVEIVNPINLGGRARVIEVANGSASIDAILSGVLNTGGMEKTGAGTLALTGTSTYVLETRISEGILQIGNGSTTGALSATTSIANNATLNFNRSDALAVSNAISGTGVVNQLGSGITTMTGSGSNAYTGLTTVSAGGLTLTKTSGATAIAGNLIVGAATLTHGGNEQIANGSTVTLNNGVAQWLLNGRTETITNLDIQNAGSAVNTGFWTGTAGKLIVTGTLTHTMGNITLNSSGGGGASVITANQVVNTGGDWLFGTGSGTQSLVIGAGGLTIGGGSLINVFATDTVLNFLRLGGDVTSQASSVSNTIGTNSSAFSTLYLEGIRTFDVADGVAGSDLVVSPIIADGTVTGGLIKTGAGTLSLEGTAASTYTGLTTINGGVLRLGKTAGLNSIAANILIGAGTLNNVTSEQIGNGATVTFNHASAGWSLVGQTETVANVDMQNASNSTSLGLATGSAGKLIVTDTLTHSAGNITFNSSTSGNESTITTNKLINTGGSWVFGIISGTQSMAIGAGGLTIGGGSTILVDATASVLNFIRLSGDVTSQASGSSNTISDNGSGFSQLRLEGTRIFDVADGAASRDLLITAAITNGTATGGLTKQGAGALALAGANTYTGATTVTAGTLAIEGSLSGTASVSVGASGTLSTDASASIGTAAVGSVTITGKLAPGGNAAGTNAGTLNLSLGTGGKLDFAAASTLLFGLGTTSDLVAFGTAGDWLSGSGNATLALDVTLAGFSYANTYTVFQNVTTAGFTFASISGYDAANYAASFAKSGNDYRVSFTAVPEPGSLVSLLGGLGLLLGLRRMRRVVRG